MRLSYSPEEQSSSQMVLGQHSWSSPEVTILHLHDPTVQVRPLWVYEPFLGHLVSNSLRLKLGEASWLGYPGMFGIWSLVHLS